MRRLEPWRHRPSALRTPNPHSGPRCPTRGHASTAPETIPDGIDTNDRVRRKRFALLEAKAHEAHSIIQIETTRPCDWDWTLVSTRLADQCQYEFFSCRNEWRPRWHAPATERRPEHLDHICSVVVLIPRDPGPRILQRRLMLRPLVRRAPLIRWVRRDSA